MSEKQEPLKLEVQLDEEMAQGVYVNLAAVNHTDTEFILDFIFVQPHAPRAKVRSRVITSPRHARRLVAALEENIRLYEQRFGPIEPPSKGATAVEAEHWH